MAEARRPKSGVHPPSGVTRAAQAASPPPASSEPAPHAAKVRTWALIAIVLFAFIGAAIVASPLWIAITLGTVLAISAQRPYRGLCRWLGRRSSWAAALVTLAAGLIVVSVGSSALVALTNELMKLVTHLQENGDAGSLSGLVGGRLAGAIERAGIDTTRLYAWLQTQLEAAASFAATTAGVVLRTTSEALLGLVVALMTMYYALIEGPGIAHRIERVSPLDPRHTRALLVEAREVAHTAFVGTIATAIVQGLLAGIGYAVLGVPQPMLWAAATALASFLPLVGTLLVWVPISGYLLVEGHPVRAIIMVAWGVFVVTSLADYVIRPRMVGGGGHAHPLLTLIALLGGIEVFGLAGLVIAPIIMSVFVAALRLYEREVKAGGVLGTTDAAGGPSPMEPSTGDAPTGDDAPDTGAPSPRGE